MHLRWLQEIAASLRDTDASVRQVRRRRGFPSGGIRPRVPLVAQFVWCPLYVGMALHPRRAAAASVTPFALTLPHQTPARTMFEFLLHGHSESRNADTGIWGYFLMSWVGTRSSMKSDLYPGTI